MSCRIKRPGLTSQRHSALISSDSEELQVCFSTVHYLKIYEKRWFSSEQRWNPQISEFEISADFLLNRADSELNSADFFWNSSETGNFQSKKSALNQNCFSAAFLWNWAEQLWFSLKQRWKTKNSEQKNQLWISAVSALIFSESELITTKAFWNSSYHS